jgi:hypothetical protein
MRLLVTLSILVSAALYTGVFAGAADIAGLPYAAYAAAVVMISMMYAAARA